jgi:hypothetical protein
MSDTSGDAVLDAAEAAPLASGDAVLEEYERSVIEKGLLARKVRARLAQGDAAEFARLVLRDERTGKRVKLAPIHEAWHRLADEHPRLVIWSHVESGKTQQLSILRVLWSLGQDPTRRWAVISNTYGQAEKIVRSIAQHIERNEDVRAVFPKLRKGEPWMSGAITVSRAGLPGASKDPSIQACGVHGNITGSRLEGVILDDVLDFENTRTARLRADLYDWFRATVLGRLTDWGRIICVGTAYHRDDLLHRFARGGLWKAARFPILNEQGASSWPQRWPQERIAARRVELGPSEFARQMLCMARDATDARFQRAWIDRCLERGRGLSLIDKLDIVPADGGTFTGVDLAVSQNVDADLTVLFTILVRPNGDRQVIQLHSGKWSGPEIVKRIIDAHRRYHSIVYVENNAAQDFVLQFAREHSAVPIRPFTTGRNKAHPEFGVESLAVEMENEKWIIPNQGEHAIDPELQAWIDELTYYDPREHTGDRLMASWFAREGARRYERSKKGSVGVKVIG